MLMIFFSENTTCAQKIPPRKSHRHFVIVHSQILLKKYCRKKRLRSHSGREFEMNAIYKAKRSIHYARKNIFKNQIGRKRETAVPKKASEVPNPRRTIPDLKKTGKKCIFDTHPPSQIQWSNIRSSSVKFLSKNQLKISLIMRHLLVLINSDAIIEEHKWKTYAKCDHPTNKHSPYHLEKSYKFEYQSLD